MDFSDALREMKAGEKARRVIWRGNSLYGPATMEIMTLTTPDGRPVQQLMVCRPGAVFPFAGSQWDILSDDWEIVTDE